MKKYKTILILISLSTIFVLTVFKNSLHGLDNGNTNVFHEDLLRIEHAEPNKDFENAVDQGDIKFVGLMGYALYFPGIDDSAIESDIHNGKYEYWIIGGTTDAIINDEHARLISIASEYASTYNRLLIDYLKKTKKEDK